MSRTVRVIVASGLARRIFRRGSASVAAAMAIAVSAFVGISASSATTGVTASPSASKTSAAVKPPAPIASRGELVVCSDEVEPPFAFRTGSTLGGSEVDIMNAVGRLFGVKTVYSQIGFDGLFAALDAGKCDAAIDEVSDTPAREQSIADVDYMAVGQTFMVTSGNPLGLKKFSELCGHAVGAVLASVDLEYLQVLSKQCTSAKHPAIAIQGFNDDPTGVEALITHKIDAFEEDTPILVGLVAQAAGKVQLSPQPQVRRIPCGIAVARSDTALQTAMRAALNKLYTDGAMRQILARYKESAVALHGANPVTVDAATRGT